MIENIVGSYNMENVSSNYDSEKASKHYEMILSWFPFLGLYDVPNHIKIDIMSFTLYQTLPLHKQIAIRMVLENRESEEISSAIK